MTEIRVMITLGSFEMAAEKVPEGNLGSLFTHLATSLSTKPIATALAEVALSLGAHGSNVLWCARHQETSQPR